MEKREIKFRAWDGIRMTTSGIMFNTSTGYLEVPTEASFGGKLTEKSKYVLMQYTGLKDKNGKEIYEGDISKNYYKGEWVYLEVCWNPLGMWSVKWKDGYLNNYYIQNQNMEIIGNIYEPTP